MHLDLFRFCPMAAPPIRKEIFFRPNRVKSLTQQGWFIGLTLLNTAALKAAPASDPAPPEIHEVSSVEPKKPEAFDRLTEYNPPAPRHSEAINADWPRFLGPTDNCISPETHLLSSFPEDGPAKVWEMKKGSGYTSPVIADGKLVFFDRMEDEETIDCLDPESGRRFWSHSYPVEYSDRYGFNNGPRASAVLSGGKVYTLGVSSILTCLDLASGSLIWQRNLDEEFELADFFFGHGSCPLIYEGKLIVPMGTDLEEKGISVAAFDGNTGKLLWVTEHEWNSSYASPIIADLQGEPRLLVFQGGESDPAFGGLLAINPQNGDLIDAFPWRPDKYESVNSSTPVPVGNDQVFLTASYQHGAVLLKFNESLKWETVWEAPEFGMHWMTPLLLDGQLYGFRGRNEPDAWLASYNVATGKENWREDEEWKIPLESGRDYRMKYLRGSLLHADKKTYALGELGSLGIFNLSNEGVETLDRTQLFLARSTWSLPVLHRGLLYVSQHEADVDGNGPRLICYDFRAGTQ